VSDPAPNVAPPPGHPRFPLLDGVRALAALSIVLLHVGDATGFARTSRLGAFTARMDAGVALFFVLSGFLLYRPFVASRLEARPAPSAGRYLRRRLLRIVPAFWVAMLVMGALGWISVLNGDWWRYFGFLQNLSVETVLGGIRPAWSLCVEMSFYLVLPLWALGAARALGGRPRARQIRLEAETQTARIAELNTALEIARQEMKERGRMRLRNAMPTAPRSWNCEASRRRSLHRPLGGSPRRVGSPTGTRAGASGPRRSGHRVRLDSRRARAPLARAFEGTTT